MLNIITLYMEENSIKSTKEIDKNFIKIVKKLFSNPPMKLPRRSR